MVSHQPPRIRKEEISLGTRPGTLGHRGELFEGHWGIRNLEDNKKEGDYSKWAPPHSARARDQRWYKQHDELLGITEKANARNICEHPFSSRSAQAKTGHH
ncbi:hypothetical protein AN398_03290 [Corynebacterium pseudotuberculosis]|nr:hypothetical protein AN398_03290 [Corynebacterium pseudotuberculosis]